MKKTIVFALLFIFVLGLFGCSKETASVGIIGGADGPTAIFITSGTNWINIYSFIGAIIVIAFIAYFIYRNKK